MRGEERVCLEEGVSQGALDGGLELLLGGRAETGGRSQLVFRVWRGRSGDMIAYSFLNMLGGFVWSSRIKLGSVCLDI